MSSQRWKSYAPFLLALVFYSVYTNQSHGNDGDVAWYASYCRPLWEKKWLFRDFQIPYPPFSLAIFCPPMVLSGPAPESWMIYRFFFAVQMLCWGGVLAWGVYRISQLNRDSATVLQCRLSFLTLFYCLAAPVLVFRFDLFPAFLTAWSLVEVLQGHGKRSGLSLALGVTTKIYPVILLPVFSFFLYFRWGSSKTKSFMFTFLIATLGILGPAFILTKNGLPQFIAFHQQRGLHLESFQGSILAFIHLFYPLSIRPVLNYNAWHLDGSSPQKLAALSPVFVFFFCSIAWGLAFFRLRRFKEEGSLQALIESVVLVLLTFILTNKVFSPQFLIWLFPFLPFIKRRYILFFVASELFAFILYPFFDGPLQRLEASGVLLLFFRNFSLFLLWILLVVERFIPLEISRRSSFRKN